jgi:HEAT repeat protein
MIRHALHQGFQHEHEEVRNAARGLLFAEGGRFFDELKDYTQSPEESHSQFLDLLAWNSLVPEEALKSQDAFIHVMALAGLVLSKDKRSASAIIESAKSSNLEIRQHALILMSMVHDERAKTLLLKASRAPEPEIRAEALFSLARLHAKGAEKVMHRSLRDPALLVRVNAIQGLRSLESNAAIKPLIQIAQESPSPIERQEAISTLWTLSAKALMDTTQATSSKGRGKTRAPAKKKTPTKKRPARKH